MLMPGLFGSPVFPRTDTRRKKWNVGSHDDDRSTMDEISAGWSCLMTDHCFLESGRRKFLVPFVLVLLSLGYGALGFSFRPLESAFGVPRPAQNPSRKPRLFRSDQYLLKVAKEDVRSQHDQRAKKALDELLAAHPQSILRGPAFLLLARIASREAVRSGRRDDNTPMKLFRKAEEVPPSGWDQGEVRYRMGQYLIRRRFGVEGRGLLEQVLSRYSRGAWAFRAKLLMADSFRSERRLARAEAILKEINPEKGGFSGTKEDRVRYDYESGHLLMDKGRFGEAQDFFVKALKLSPAYPYRHPGILFLLGRYSYSQKHNRRAAILFRTFIRFFPDDERSSDSQYYLARISGRMGRTSHERARLREVISDNPHSTGSHLAKLRLIQMTFFSGTGTSSAPLPEVQDRAIKTLARLERLETNKRIAGEAAILRVRLLDLTGKNDEAMRILSRLQGDTDLSGSFGKRLLAEEQSILMKKILALSNPMHPGNILALYHSYRYRLPDPASPGGGTLSLLLARAEWKLGRADQAFRFLDQVQKNPYDTRDRNRALYLRYRWLLARNQASSALNLAIDQSSRKTLPPSDRALWLARASGLAKKQGNRDVERRILGAELSSGLPVPHRGRVLARLGLLDLSAGKEEEGRDKLLQALPEIQNETGQKELRSDVLFHLGQISWARGEKANAGEYWQAMIQCCPSDKRRPWVMYQMGNMALENGDRAGALDWFSMAVKSSGGTDIGKVARLKIEAMGLEKKGEEH